MPTDLREFRTAAHAIAGATGARLAGFRIADGVTPNFHQAILVYPDRTVAVVCSRDQPLLALAQPREDTSDSSPLTFLDGPAQDIPGFRWLGPADLAAPFEAAAWPDVDPKDVRYWRPGTVGEALFHYWD